MKRWSTVQAFIANGKSPASETVVSFEGFASKGDGGASLWVKTGETGAASQSPVARNDNKMTDRDGVVYKPTPGTVFYYNGSNNWFPSPFGNDGQGLYQFDGSGWNFYEESGGAVPLSVTSDLFLSSFDYNVGSALSFSGYASTGDGAVSQWVKTSDIGTPSQSPAQRGDGTLTDALGYIWKLSHGTSLFDIEYRIPSDFATLQEAIDFTYNKISLTSDAFITLLIENSHEPSAGLVCTGMDLSQYIIKSNVRIMLGDVYGSFLYFDGTRAPVIDATFDAINSPNIDVGFHYLNVSSGTVNPNKGINNVNAPVTGGFKGDGLLLENGSSVNASNSIFQGCNLRNVHVTTGSTCELSGADVSNGLGDFNVWISRRSRVVADGLTCTGGAGGGIAVLRSELSLTPFSTRDLDISGNGGDNITINDNSSVFMGARSGRKVICSNAGRDNINIAGCSRVDAEGADLSGAGRAGINATASSQANAPRANITGATSVAVRANGAATVDVDDSDCSGHGDRGVHATRGAIVNARTVDATGTAGVTENDFLVEDGAVIIANGGTGGLSQTANTMTRDGIIYGGAVTSTVPAPIDSTVTLINNKFPQYSAGATVQTFGYDTAGDDGGAPWVKTSDTDTPSQSPIQRGNGTLTDASGAVWRIVGDYINIKSLGAASDLAGALVAANAHCLAYSKVMTGAGSGTLSSSVTLSAPYINLSAYTIEIDSSLNTSAAVVYEGSSNDLEHTSFVNMRFDGDRDSRSQDITAFLLQRAPSADSLYNIYGRSCNTLCNISGNVERTEVHVKGVFVDTLVLESGTSPDTNRIYISGGQYKRAYHKTSSTTSQVTLNCQAQEAGAGVYAIEIDGERGTTLSGELRVITHGAVKYSGGASGNSFINFNSLHFESVDNATVEALDIDECSNLQGKCTITAISGLPCHLKTVNSADFSLNILDCSYTGYHVIFGDSANAKTCSGKYSITDRSADAASEGASFERIGSVDVYFDGSALPIDIQATVNNDAVNISVEQSYILSDVAINTNGVRVNCYVRGLLITSDILAYSTPFRGMNCLNLNTNGLVFHDGTNWQRYTSSALS